MVFLFFIIALSKSIPKLNGNLTKSIPSVSSMLSKSIPKPPELPDIQTLPKPDSSVFENQNSGPVVHFRGQAYMNLSNHLDQVRSLAYYSSSQTHYVLSASEDCLVKLWKVDAFRRGKDTFGTLLTYRGHNCQIYSCCFVNGIPYSADIKGNIIRWKLPPTSYILTEDIPTLYHLPEKIVKAHDDVIWKLKPSYYNSQFISVSSDLTIKLWESNDTDCIYIILFI